MKTEILNRVAEIVRNPVAIHKSSTEQARKSEKKDTVEISSKGSQRLENSQKLETQFEKERFERVERLRDQVSSGTYNLSPEMVDEIAKRIANTL